jgi:acyl dehydratase
VEYSVQNREIVYAGETLWFTATVTGKRALDSLALVDLDERCLQQSFPLGGGNLYRNLLSHNN